MVSDSSNDGKSRAARRRRSWPIAKILHTSAQEPLRNQGLKHEVRLGNTSVDNKHVLERVGIRSYTLVPPCDRHELLLVAGRAHQRVIASEPGNRCGKTTSSEATQINSSTLTARTRLDSTSDDSRHLGPCGRNWGRSKQTTCISLVILSSF